MAVRRDDEVAASRVSMTYADELAVVLGHREADRVGDVERGRAVVDRDLADLAHEVGVGAAAVLGRELDVVACSRVARATAAAASAFTWSCVMRSFFSMWIFDVAMKTWMRGLLGVAHRLPRPVDVLERRCARGRR